MFTTKKALSWALLLIAGSLASTAQATIIWDWSFDSESGQFVTDGTTADPGNFLLLDFSVVSSATGGTIGSLSEGDYATGDFLTDQPYTFNWDGSAVTDWLKTGGNTFDWWLFEDPVLNTYYFFGWDTGNVNDPTRAARWSGSNFEPLAVGDVSVRVTAQAVPEPATILLLGLGLIGVGAARRRGMLSE